MRTNRSSDKNAQMTGPDPVRSFRQARISNIGGELVIHATPLWETSVRTRNRGQDSIGRSKLAPDLPPRRTNASEMGNPAVDRGMRVEGRWHLSAACLSSQVLRGRSVR